jgi:hypothetical protein
MAEINPCNLEETEPSNFMLMRVDLLSYVNAGKET